MPFDFKKQFPEGAGFVPVHVSVKCKGLLRETMTHDILALRFTSSLGGQDQ